MIPFGKKVGNVTLQNLLHRVACPGRSYKCALKSDCENRVHTVAVYYLHMHDLVSGFLQMNPSSRSLVCEVIKRSRK